MIEVIIVKIILLLMLFLTTLLLIGFVVVLVWNLVCMILSFTKWGGELL